jgi:MarR family transcriptional regulator, organic hydroperoxide resistance regulator
MSSSKLRVYHKLQLAAHRVQKSADRALLATAKVNTAQAAVLAVVAAEGTITQREVARQLGINESAMTSMVGRLQRMGLLRRDRDDADVRAWRLSLSESGRGTLKRVEPPFRRINQTIEEVLATEEIARLADYLGRIANAFDEN